MIKISEEFQDLIPIIRMTAVEIAWKYHNVKKGNGSIEEVAELFLNEFKKIKSGRFSNRYHNKAISIRFIIELFNELLELGKENS